MSLTAKIGQAVGTAALSTLGPVGIALAGALNAYLGDDDKVNTEAPMTEVDAKFDKLTPTQQNEVLKTYYTTQVQLQTTNNNREVSITSEMEESDRAGTSNKIGRAHV